MASNPNAKAMAVLKRLRSRHNVLIAGVPGCGKSLLMGEVGQMFLGAGKPGYEPSSPVFLPNASVPDVQEWLPSPHCSKRRVFSTAFHQGTKYRDFVRGVIPDLRDGHTGFRVTSGVLYEAAEFARQDDCAALVLIDEINRGPAVQVFGDALVALDSDKRLGSDGQPTVTSQAFRILSDKGEYEEYYLPTDLYLVAAMNQADSSVEPMDVAFLRRWDPYRLEPQRDVLEAYFGLDASSSTVAGPAKQLYRLFVDAWSEVNARLRRGRGPEYMLGHGIVMAPQAAPTAADEASEFVAAAWARVFAHVDEVFFGDVRGAAVTLNIGAGSHPLSLTEHYFGDTPVLELNGDPRPEAGQVAGLLSAVVGSSQE